MTWPNVSRANAVSRSLSTAAVVTSRCGASNPSTVAEFAGEGMIRKTGAEIKFCRELWERL